MHVFFISYYYMYVSGENPATADVNLLKAIGLALQKDNPK